MMSAPGIYEYNAAEASDGFTLGQDPNISAEANAAVLAIFNEIAGDDEPDSNPGCTCRTYATPSGTGDGYGGNFTDPTDCPVHDDSAPSTCFCGEPLTQQTWCGCSEGLYRLTDERQNRTKDECDQGADEIGAERQRSREARADDQDFGCSDADLGQLAATQEWAAHQNALNRIFDTQ